MTRLEKVLQVMQSPEPDWSLVSLAEVSTAIGEILSSRKSHLKLASPEERAERSRDLAQKLDVLYRVSASKWASRGDKQLAKKISELEAQVNDPDPFWGGNVYRELHLKYLLEEQSKANERV